MSRPLVSVVITNFNYAKYLGRCMQSVLDQTYENIELIVCDNDSSDGSVPLVLDFVQRYKGRISLVRHRNNIGPASNFISGQRLIRGDYFINLGADDYLESGYVELALGLFKKYPGVSQIISHADSVNDEGVRTRRTPFFDGSYLMDGKAYAPILMVAGVTSHTSQTIFSTMIHDQLTSRPDFIYSSTLGERTTAMMHAVSHDLIFLDHPFVICRDSVNNETFKLNSDLSQIVEQWSVINAFLHFAQLNNFEQISARRNDAFAKLAELCTRYAAEFKRIGKADIAGRYLGLSLVLGGSFDALLEDGSASGLEKTLAKIRQVTGQIEEMGIASPLIRNHSYPPPAGSVRLEFPLP